MRIPIEGVQTLVPAPLLGWITEGHSVKGASALQASRSEARTESS
jgi:hypothetical protein